MAVNPMMESVMSAGVHGMNAALNGVRGAAEEIAAINATARSGSGPNAQPAADDTQGLVDALTSLKLYERQVQASSQVVKTADELLGNLLDIHA